MARRKAAGAWLLAAVLLLFGTASAWAEFGQRYALVVGNSDYAQVEHLPNTAGDAVAVADALEALHFTVFRGIDLDRERFERLIAEFRTASQDADAVVFYYAGHGFQLRGRNHLVPVDAVLRDRSEIDTETFVLDDVIKRIHRSGRPTIVMLDACRNSPLPPSVQDDTADGLAQLQTGDDTLIAFATQPGNVSYDGTSKHSPFTEALLTHIGEPQQTIFDLMINVRNEVSRRTLDRQVPWVQFSLRQSFSFNPTSQTIARSTPARHDDDRQGIVISRGGPGGHSAGAAETEPAQVEPSREVPPADTAAPVPRIRFATTPDTSQQAALPPEEPPQPPQEPAKQRQPVAERATEDADPPDAVNGDTAESATPVRPESGATGRLAPAQEPAPADGDSASTSPSDRDAEHDGAPQADAPPAEAQADAPRAEETSAAAAAEEPPASRSPAADIEQQEPPAAEQQIAALPREEVEPEPEPESRLDGEELVRLIQQNLQRLGCYRLGIDGDWGPGSRSGLETFYREAGETADSLEPSPDVLARLEQESGKVCPPPKVKSPPKPPEKSRVAAPAPKQPARQKQPAPQRQPTPAPQPAKKSPPRVIGF